MCPEQVRAAKFQRIHAALEQGAALAPLRQRFTKPFGDMSPEEQERYLDRRAVLIENDLARYYLKNVNPQSKAKKPNKSRSPSKENHRSATSSLRRPSDNSVSSDSEEEDPFADPSSKLSLPAMGNQSFIK